MPLHPTRISIAPWGWTLRTARDLGEREDKRRRESSARHGEWTACRPSAPCGDSPADRKNLAV
eukprot:6551137-Prymnesium_polylepis.2